MFSSLSYPGEDNDGCRDDEPEFEAEDDTVEEEEDDRDEEQEGRWEAADDLFTEKYEEGEN